MSSAFPFSPALSPVLGAAVDGVSARPALSTRALSFAPTDDLNDREDIWRRPELSPVIPAPVLEEGRSSASLHLGDLDIWMDEAYVRECCARMGWDGVTHVKMIRGASPSNGYCFLTFPTAAHAAQVLARFAAAPPVLMPRSSRVFKLNWGTGLPGVQPRWDGEYSVFVGDLGREVGEAELVSLFTPLFPSTKSAKIMYDPSTGVSRGYGFVRFADEADMQRALHLGQHAGSGLSLHGRTLRISEASGPGNAPDNLGRERSRTRSADGLPPLPPNAAAYVYPQQETYPNTNVDYRSPTFPTAQYPSMPLSPASQQFGQVPQYGRNGPVSPAMQYGQPQLAHNHHNGGGNSHTTDPNNTTVFVGGLPACISEETLKSFFHHFGEITYCKIPTGKGCGFVQFVRRPDAELAIAKMNDFPIHGKSRIRLSWGRSQGDKQVEHVRKLASALGVPFEAVWRMVQGQDNSTIKQITTAVGGAPAVLGSRFDALGMGRMELGAVASAAGLTEAEVLELVGGRSGSAEAYGSSAPSPASDFFNRGGGPATDVNGLPYARVSPGFGGFSGQANASSLPLSPPPSAQYSQGYMQQQQNGYGHQYGQPANAYASPYASGEFDAARGGDRFAPAQGYQQYGQRYPAPASLYSDPHARQTSYASSQSSYSHEHAPPSSTTTLEDSFSNLGFASSPLPPREFGSTGGDGFLSAMGTTEERSAAGGAQWC